MWEEGGACKYSLTAGIEVLIFDPNRLEEISRLISAKLKTWSVNWPGTCIWKLNVTRLFVYMFWLVQYNFTPSNSFQSSDLAADLRTCFKTQVSQHTTCILQVIQNYVSAFPWDFLSHKDSPLIIYFVSLSLTELYQTGIFYKITEDGVRSQSQTETDFTVRKQTITLIIILSNHTWRH